MFSLQGQLSWETIDSDWFGNLHWRLPRPIHICSSKVSLITSVMSRLFLHSIVSQSLCYLHPSQVPWVFASCHFICPRNRCLQPGEAKEDSRQIWARSNSVRWGLVRVWEDPICCRAAPPPSRYVLKVVRHYLSYLIINLSFVSLCWKTSVIAHKVSSFFQVKVWLLLLLFFLTICTYT